MGRSKSRLERTSGLWGAEQRTELSGPSDPSGDDGARRDPIRDGQQALVVTPSESRDRSMEIRNHCTMEGPMREGRKGVSLPRRPFMFLLADWRCLKNPGSATGPLRSRRSFDWSVRQDEGLPENIGTREVGATAPPIYGPSRDTKSPKRMKKHALRRSDRAPRRSKAQTAAVGFRHNGPGRREYVSSWEPAQPRPTSGHRSRL